MYTHKRGRRDNNWLKLHTELGEGHCPLACDVEFIGDGISRLRVLGTYKGSKQVFVIGLTELCLLGALIDELLLGIRRGRFRFWMLRLAVCGFLAIYRGLGKSSIVIFDWGLWRC